jgi:hypothetical protein
LERRETTLSRISRIHKVLLSLSQKETRKEMGRRGRDQLLEERLKMLKIEKKSQFWKIGKQTLCWMKPCVWSKSSVKMESTSHQMRAQMAL